MSSSVRLQSIRSRPTTLARATLDLGPAAMLEYAVYRLALRSGWLRAQTPVRTWDDLPLSRLLRSGVPAEAQGYWDYRRGRPRLLAHGEAGAALKAALETNRLSILAESEEILRGEFRLFGGPVRKLGFPPDWGAFAVEPAESPPARLDLDRHWTTYLAVDPPADIKLVWEASRFAWVYPLASAYRLTGEQRYADRCWQLIDSWRAANAPNTGPHWASAQEAAIRILALAFALEALEPWLSGEPVRAAALAQMVAVHARRIPCTLGYARSLRNNHLLTEAVGLYTAGAAFPEFRQAARWRALGRFWLSQALQAQVFADGGHIQYSGNYQRQVVEAGLWAAHVAEVEAHPLPSSTLDSIRRGAGFLGYIVDPATGGAPNMGANDGGRLLPVPGSDFGDVRPVLQLAAQIVGGRPLQAGAWDLAAAWLGRRPGHGPLPTVHSTPVSDFPQAGLYLMGDPANRGLLRCAQFKNRPGHSDQLHFELRCRGEALARDPGTYLYNGAPPWDNALARAEMHNTVLVDSEEPMRQAGPFLWLEWAQGRLIGRWASPGGALEALAGEHDGYGRLGVTHRRTAIRAGDDLWLVADDLLGSGEHQVHVLWQLPDAASARLQGEALSMPFAGGYVVIQMEMPGDLFTGPVLRLGLYRAGECVAGEIETQARPTWGWWSPTYADRQAGLTLAAEARGTLPMRILTWWCLGRHGQESLEATWRAPGSGPAAAERLGFEGDTLEIGA